MNSPKSTFRETDLTTAPRETPSGISGVLVKTLGGPIANPNILITSWAQFVRLYGGFLDGDIASLLAKRALEGGSALRVSRLVHYTDPTDALSFDAEFSAMGNSNRHTLAGALNVDHTITYTPDGVEAVVTQVFDTSSLKTLQLLAAKIKAAFGSVQDVVVVSSTRILVIPYAALGADVLAVTGTAAPAVVRVAIDEIQDSAGNNLFGLVPKYPGALYNNIRSRITAASNGNAAYFDLYIDHLLDPEQSESYKNLRIVGSPTAVNSHYLDDVIKRSKIVDVNYGDLSAIVANPIVPVPFTIKFMTGTDGANWDAADAIGDSSAKTGFSSFDGIDDVMQIALLAEPDDIDPAIHAAGAAYAEARKDLQYFIALFSEDQTEADLVTEKDALNIDSSYAMIFGGNIKVVDPSDGVEKSISAIGDILGLAASADINFGPWYSFAGFNRGGIQNSLGADNLFGAPGNSLNLDILANHQINIVINRSRKTLLWGCFTGQLATSQLSLANVRRLHIHLKKSLGSLLERFLEEPNDIPTWKQIYISVQPFLSNLVSRRAMYDFRWEGDQFVKDMDSLIINNSADVTLGKYKARLFVKDISSMQEFALDVTLTPAGVSFEDALLISQPV